MMMSEHIFYQEWRTKNAVRRYPFADDCTMKSSDGVALADDVFLDAMFYPAGLSGNLYLSGIILSENKIVVSDSKGAVAEAALTQDNGSLDFYDIYGRCIGVLVAGPGFAGLGGDLSFPYASTPFAAGCVVPQTYQCLNGLLLEDGTLVTGDVYWEGENGMQVTTEYIDGVPVVRFDAVGEISGGCGLGDPIKCLKISQVGSGKALVISQTGNIITLSTPYTLQDLCVAKQELPDEYGNLPADDDMCDDPPEPPPCDPPLPHSEECPVPHQTEYFIWPATDSVGAELVETPPGSGADKLMQGIVSTNPASLPERTTYALKLFMKGI